MSSIRGSVASSSILGSFISNAAAVEFDPNASANEIRKKQLIGQVGQLQEERIKLDQEFERVSFQKDQCETDKITDFYDLLQKKVATEKGIRKKIEKYSK